MRLRYLPIGILDCRIVFFDENSLNELDGLEKKKKKRVVNMEKESKGRDVRETRDDEKRRFLTSADFPTPPDPRTTSLYSRIVGLEREKSDDRTPNSANSARGVPESSATA